MNPSAGYSGTPLPQKLGLKANGTLVLLQAPKDIERLLVPLPEGARCLRRRPPSLLLALLFCHNRAALVTALPDVSASLDAEGALWIAWPKKSSPLYVDLTEDDIRREVLPRGLVDVKVCAIDADWSGLKLMVRKENRATWNK